MVESEQCTESNYTPYPYYPYGDQLYMAYPYPYNKNVLSICTIVDL